ncbi:type II secretion system F family protein [Brevibacillus dissolubilis]|uniref:type II secretion system F family protein n=1 Tax=Brevibacillus dissolubilis TaxID=1844116 RepID=UPI0011161431|nr:type II secretion system F family protein [Brevibacillus dissolubilis]
MIEWLFIIAVGISVCGLLYSVLEQVMTRKRRLARRIRQHLPKDIKRLEDIPLLTRLTKPMTAAISPLLEHILPHRYKDLLAVRLSKSEAAMSMQELLFLKLLLLFAAAFFLYMIESPFLYIVPLLVFFLPDIHLRRQITKRQMDILYELPYMIDILGVIVESGVAFDNAITKICARKKGPLYAEFSQYLHEVRMGRSRDEALLAMSERVQLQDLKTFVQAIIQGERMGVGILNTIRMQARQLRRKRRQRLQEQAMKLPVKILFPIVFFIFPPLFIVILGPGLIRLMEVFLQ